MTAALLCGHYEGFDERIRSLADEEAPWGILCHRW